MKPSTKEKQNGLFSIGKFGIRGLRIAASTIAIVEILKHDYSFGVSYQNRMTSITRYKLNLLPAKN